MTTSVDLTTQRANIDAAPSDGAAVTPSMGRRAAAEIDRRRSRQLLDRAMALADRGDLHNAVLSCRQAIALAPRSVQGYSMLGLLMERGGDTAKAIKAYEKVLALSPDSLLERDSLQRLRATSPSRNTVFNFDEAELFADLPEDETQDEFLPAAPPLIIAQPNGNQPDGNRPNGGRPNGDVIRRTPAPRGPIAAAPPNTVAGASATGVPHPLPRQPARPAPAIKTAPAATLRPATAVAAPTVAAPTATAPAIATATVTVPNVAAPVLYDMEAAVPATSNAATGWQRLLSHSSFYYRGLPLIIVALLSLLFLGWAQSRARLRENVAPRVGSTSTTFGAPAGSLAPAQNVLGAASPAGNITSDTNGSGAATGPATGVVAQASGGAMNIQNQPEPPAAANGNSGDQRSTSGAGATAGGSRTQASIVRNRATSQRSAAASPRPIPETRQVPPFPVPSLPRVESGGSGGGAGGDISGGTNTARPARNNDVDGFTLPPARNAVESGTTAGAVAGNGPFSPNAGRGRETITIAPASPSPATAPPRPENRARAAERAASQAAAEGNSNRAPDRPTEATRTGTSTGYGYQQRGLALMERGEYSRAIDNFRTAISAYQDQVRQNRNAGEARAGIQACQNGIKLAQSLSR